MAWFIPDIIKIAARNLRKNMTNSEELIWGELKTKKLWYKFLRQKPLYLYTEDSWLDRYIIPDFVCLDLKLVLEIDWNVHDKEDVYLLDIEKEKLLNQKWFKVIRIRNEEIQNNIQNTIEKIVASFP
jgi:very-short-patch-repair endonuclease